MFMKLFAGLALVAGLTLSGLAAGHFDKSCCSPGSECCFPGSPCCEGDATTTAGTCCYPGSECCFPGSPCCESFVSAGTDAAPKPKAACAGCKGCCAAQKAGQPARADLKASKLVVDEMTCAGCAKAVRKAVSAVAGVDAATVDLKSKTVTVTPKSGKTPAPKELWEAVEKAGYKPLKLVGPDGTFEKKPAK